MSERGPVRGGADRASGLKGASGTDPLRAIVDIGSNTVRAVLYGGPPRAPEVLFNEKVVAQLGRGVARDGRLAPEGMELALSALARYALLLRDLRVPDVRCVATAAVREAENGPEFLNQAEGLGFAPRLLSGEEEARISALGVLAAFPGAGGIIADLGGGSLELARVENADVGERISLPLGTLRLAALRKAKGAGAQKALDKALADSGWSSAAGGTLYLVGGTWRAMAVEAMHAADWPLSDPHGFEMSARDALAAAQRLAAADSDALLETPRLSAMRAGKLPDAARLLGALLRFLRPERLVFSAWGLREGLLFENAPSYAWASDPFLAGVTAFGAQHAVSPRLATRIAAWTADALPAAGRGEERLRLAGTTLALASMRVEPNLRLSHALDWALHKRWIGVGAEGRGAVAACLYGNAAEPMPDRLRQIAPAELLDRAYGWGVATRLCRRLGAPSHAYLRDSTLTQEGGELVLRMDPAHAALFGPANARDLRRLGELLGCAFRFEASAMSMPLEPETNKIA